MKKEMIKSAKNSAQNDEIAISQDLMNEIKMYNRAHYRLVNKLIEFKASPTFVLSILHAIHATSMNYEEDAVWTMLGTQNEQKGE